MKRWSISGSLDSSFEAYYSRLYKRQELRNDKNNQRWTPKINPWETEQSSNISAWTSKQQEEKNVSETKENTSFQVPVQFQVDVKCSNPSPSTERRHGVYNHGYTDNTNARLKQNFVGENDKNDENSNRNEDWDFEKLLATFSKFDIIDNDVTTDTRSAYRDNINIKPDLKTSGTCNILEKNENERKIVWNRSRQSFNIRRHSDIFLERTNEDSVYWDDRGQIRNNLRSRDNARQTSADEKLRNLGGKSHFHSNQKAEVQEQPRYADFSDRFPSKSSRQEKEELVTSQPVPNHPVYIQKDEVAPPRPPLPYCMTVGNDQDQIGTEMSTRHGHLTVTKGPDVNMSNPVQKESFKQPRASKVKRRSRSAGPGKKQRKSIDERQNADQGSKKRNTSRHSMYTEPLSDEGGFPDLRDSSSLSSESDENQKQWVKNPLILKRNKKGEKKFAGKSNTSNNSFGSSVGPRDFKTNVSQIDDRTHDNKMRGRPQQLLLSDKNSGNASNKNKFQRREERRKQRIDMMVTSDEEFNSPECRISRLRQRALQESKTAKIPEILGENVMSQQQNKNSPPTKEIRRDPIGVPVTHRPYEATRIQQPMSANPYIEAQQSHDSSSSEHIVLRPFGPGVSYPTPSPVSQRRHTNLQQTLNTQLSNLKAVQGYRKIPKQVTDGMEVTINMNTNNQSDGISVHGKQTENVMPCKVEDLSSTHMLKTPMPRVDNKRRSHSDDSLDDLIEANLEYLESEIESGKLQKINQPSAFPVTNQPFSIHSNNQNKNTNIFQNEVKARLQQQPIRLFNQEGHSSYDNKSATTSQYDELSPLTSLSTNNSGNFYQQRTLPKADKPQEPTSPYPTKKQVNSTNQMSKSTGSLFEDNMYGAQYQTPGQWYSQSKNVNLHQPSFSNSENKMMESNTAAQLAPTKNLTVQGQDANSGMFSDVDYDIEVSERVKKWEKFMSAPSVAGEKEAVSLATILEGDGGIPDKWLNQMVSSTSQCQPDASVSSISVTVKKSTAHLHPKKTQQFGTQKRLCPLSPLEKSSESHIKLLREPATSSMMQKTSALGRASDMYSSYNNTCEQDNNEQQRNYISRTEPFKLDIYQQHQHQNYQQPVVNYLSQSMVESESNKNFPDEARMCVSQIQLHGSGTNTNSDNSQSNVEGVKTRKPWPPCRKKSTMEEQKALRSSKYEEELNELQNLKQDSVKDLRRRFDSDASGNESYDFTDETRSANQTPLVHRKFIMKGTHSAPPEPAGLEEKFVYHPVNRSNSIQSDRSDLQNLPEQEVWSPNLESSKGLVSIERVKARTLQTIPFSEDPFWREIENLTTFDEFSTVSNAPSEKMQESVALLKQNNAEDSSYVSDTNLASPLSPNARKTFKTPFIQPLKLNSVPKTNTASFLDDVFDNGLTQQKPLLPAKPKRAQIPTEKQSSYHPNSAPASTSASLLRSGNQLGIQSYIQYSQPVKQTVPDFAQGLTSNPSHVLSQQKLGQTKQEQTHYYAMGDNQNQNRDQQAHPQLVHAQHTNYKQEQNPTHQQSQILPPTNNRDFVQPQQYFIPEYNVGNQIINGNYQLDPSLLKEKLLDTGLVEGSDIDSVAEAQNRERDTPTPQGNMYDAISDENLIKQTMIFDNMVNAKRDHVVPDTGEQVLETVEQLKNLAKDVEVCLSQIRQKMDNKTDENQLDNLLSALKCVQPTAESPQMQSKAVPYTLSGSKNVSNKEGILSENKSLQYSHQSNGSDLIHKKGFTIPRQSRTSHETHVTIRPQIKKRTKSDSDCSVTNYQDSASLAEIERQTQKEFEDITKAFQTLLAEVDKTDTADFLPTSPVKTKDNSNYACDIEASIQSFLQDHKNTNVNTSSHMNKVLRDINSKQVQRANSCREVQKSEVFTANHGPFSVLVGLNGNSKMARAQRSAPAPDPGTDIVQLPKSSGLSWQTNKAYAAISSTTTTATNDREQNSLEGIQDCSDSSEASRGKPNIPRRFRKSKNFQHRKSMPAEILKRSVETQTSESCVPEEVSKGKSQDVTDDLTSSENEKQDIQPHRKKLSRNVAAKVDLFSSSEDEKFRKAGLRHSLSAPDLYAAVASELSSSKQRQTKIKMRAPKNRKALKKSTQSPEEKISDEMWISDDSVHAPGSKPPRPPASYQRSTSPDRSFGGCVGSNSSRLTSQSDTESVSSRCEIVLNKKKENLSSEDTERPNSFHELLSLFEPDFKHVQKLRYSLRKCASADTIQDMTVFRKTYLSEPDLRENTPPVQLNLEMEFKFS